jgi:hypothetical protein
MAREAGVKGVSGSEVARIVGLQSGEISQAAAG